MTKLNVLARASASAIALTAGCLAFASSASAAELRGRIFDEISKSALPGAVVSIKGTSLSETTERDGSFSFSNLKPGLYTVTVD